MFALGEWERGQPVFSLALILKLLFVALVTWASYRHFARSGREPAGATALALATGLGTGANVWFALEEPRAGVSSSLIAASLVILATAVFIAAVHATRNGGLSLAFSDRTPPAVIESGIYGVIRHPFYASYCLYWLAWVPLTAAHPVSIGIAVAMIAGYVAAVRKEERLLTKRLGDAYSSLMRRTWRLLPGIY